MFLTQRKEKYLDSGVEISAFYVIFSYVAGQSSGSDMNNAPKLLYSVYWIYAHIFFDLCPSLSSRQQHPSPDLPFVCVHCFVCRSPLFLCINSVPFSCRLTSERLVYFCWGENRRVFIPSLPYLQFFLLLIPLLSDILRQTQSHSRASYSNELIFHPGEVVLSEDRWG